MILTLIISILCNDLLVILKRQRVIHFNQQMIMKATVEDKSGNASVRCNNDHPKFDFTQLAKSIENESKVSLRN